MIRLLDNSGNWVGRNLAARMNERLRKASLGRANTRVRSEWQRASQQGLMGTRWGAGGKKGKRSCDEVSKGHIIKSFASQEIS